MPRPPFELDYADAPTARALVTDSAKILGVVGYGAERPDFLPASCPFVATPLTPADGPAMFEIWRAAGPCDPVKIGEVTGARNDALAFGTIAIDEAGAGSLEAAVEAAYLGIFDFLDATGFAAPIRFWNYLTAITEDEDGLERYRRFNIGRQQAFSARLRQPLPPAASGVGGHSGTSVIYFLAAHEPALTVENPRQVSAYAYPPIYGPRSPSFSRASIHGAETLFISGTASIVGHQTLHLDDLSGQIDETIDNLRAVIGAAERTAAAPLSEHWAFKIYLHDAAYRETVDRAVETAFGPECRRLYLRGDMCRSELLLEIEAVGRFASGAEENKP